MGNHDCLLAAHHFIVRVVFAGFSFPTQTTYSQSHIYILFSSIASYLIPFFGPTICLAHFSRPRIIRDLGERLGGSGVL
jgi:hypothetical protein